jgi:Replication-relaxation
LSDRASGRCTNCFRFGLVRSGFGPVKRGDVYVHEVGEVMARVSWQRLAVLRGHLTDRDWPVIQMLKCVKLADGNQLRRATSGDNSPAGQRAARRQLARLVEWRVVERLERRQGGLGRGSDSWTYALGVIGQRLSGDGQPARRPVLPSELMWRHALLGAEIYTRLVEASRDGDREVALWQGEPDCWRNYPGPLGEQVRLKPDAFVIVSGPDYEDMAFVEFDNGSQSRTVMRSKIEAYRRYRASGQEQGTHDGVFPLVVIVTTTPERQAMLLDLLSFVPTEDWQLFAVGLLADAPRLLMGGAS